jgi:long-chain acyl-CoA synthetase
VKELFKTSKGKYVAPAPIENRLLAHPEIEQACVSGASMAQPYAIIVLSKSAGRSTAIERDLEAIRDEVNAAVDHHERLQAIVIAKEAWTVENGLLTPTLKLKRGAIEERYAPFVRQWYESRKSVIRAES